MMNFNDQNRPAKTIVLYYAKQLNLGLATAIVSGASDLSSKEEAESLAYFFWEMTDQAVEDENENKTIDGISDLRSWLEKALYIFTGYFTKQGYEREWSEGYDKEPLINYRIDRQGHFKQVKSAPTMHFRALPCHLSTAAGALGAHHAHLSCRSGKTFLSM